MGFLKDAKEQAKQQQEAKASRAVARAHSGMEYLVEQVRETLVGDKIKPEAVEAQVNERAAEGWLLKQAVPANVKGRVGPGGTEGLLLFFERPVV